MARCAQCNIPMLISKVTNGELRYCSTKCATNDFVPKFLTSLAEAREADPYRSRANRRLC